MAIKKDIWRIGAVKAPLSDVLKTGLISREIIWLQDTPPLTFLADPFGVWRNERLYLFAEAYDYRDRRGKIEVLVFDHTLQLVERGVALAEPWHLSYPFIVESNGNHYMIPEAIESGRLTLYRATEFPYHWEPVKIIVLDFVPVDPTPIFFDGLWWLFYTPATTWEAKVGALHVAFAEALDGPWTPHPRNPVQRDVSCSRPGGSPILVDGTLVLPMQDCRKTYGGAVRPLTVTRLTPDRFEAFPGHRIAALGQDGMHTLSAAEHLTLLDVKCFHLSPKSLLLDLQNEFRKAFL